ncbi:MAG TPA: MFS transporter [Ktedonobacterales bacterium]|nr:MFS transporter [Ktedonobacterales bacterium]
MSQVTSQPAREPAPPGAVARAGRYAAYIFWLMFIINFLNYLDRWIFTGLSDTIQRDLHLNEFEMGMLTSGFLLVYTIVALPLGFLADKVARKTIVGLGVAIWSLATAFTGLARNFTAMLIVRTFLGVGEGSYYPAGTPMLAAYYPPSRRATIIARWSVGALIGAGAGFLVATAFNSPDKWHYAFIFTGIPGLIFAFLIWRTREKTRHEDDPPAEHLLGEGSRSFLQRLAAYLRIPSFRVIVALHALGFFALTGVTSWLVIYLSDTYGSVGSFYPKEGLSPGMVSFLAGALILLGGIIGNLVGGVWSNRLARRHVGARVLTGGLGFLLAAPCVVAAVGAPMLLRQMAFFIGASIQTQLTIGIAIFSIFALLAAFFLNIYNGPVSAALLDVVPAAERGSAGGTELTLAHLCGDVYAAVLIGAIAQALEGALGGRQIGLALLLTCPLALIASGIVGIWGSRFYARDVAALGSTASEMLGTSATE